MSLITKFDAIHALVGGGIIKDGENWTFCDGQEMPSEKAIQAKLKELEVEYKKQAYARLRQSEYPNLQDCIHALLDGGDTLTELQNDRLEIKKKYPKPE